METQHNTIYYWPDPSQLQSTSDLYKKDHGISDSRIAQLAIELGLAIVPPMTPTPRAIFEWLGRYGPLWVNGTTHITVIAGINFSAKEFSLLVYDPAPVNKGKIEWRDARKWYAGTTASSRDIKTNAGIFLYVP
jgi:hypothetical protein